LAKESQQAVRGVLPRAGVKQVARGRAGQSEGVVEFPIGEESGVTGNSRAVELQLDVTVEVNAQGVMLAVTHWVPRSFRQEVVGNAGFSRKRRKCHAETTEPSGKSGFVVVTSWTDARIPWPRCRALDGPGGGSGLLIDEELARAVRHESVAALMHWWGACKGAVVRWRKALGVWRMDSEGSRRLIQAAAQAGAAVVRGQPLPPEQVEVRRRNALAHNLAQYLRTGYHGPWWTPEELALLGTLPDEVVAAQIGRTPGAVRSKPTARGIPSACDRRRRRQ
jgi:hypothetical protein